MISTLKDRNNSVKRSWWFLVLSAALSVSAAWAQQTERELYDDFIRDLHREPCVLERDDMKDALLEPSNRLRKGMAPR